MFLDAEIEYSIWPSLLLARKQAAIEASDTGGLAVPIQSIEVADKDVVMYGRLPSRLLVGEASKIGRLAVKPIGTGRFHCTWASLIQPRGCVGYIVLQPPFRIQSRFEAAMPEKPIAAACQFARTGCGFVVGSSIGMRLCRICNEPIPEARIAAVPGSTLCLSCKQNEEKERNEQ